MRTHPLSYNGFSLPRLAIALGIIFTAAPLGSLSFAADPPSGTLSVDNPLITYTSGPFLVSNPSNQVDGEPICVPATCDDFALTVSVPAGYENTHNVIITTSWLNPAEDYDIFLLQGDTYIKDGASSSDPEIMIVDANSGAYTIRINPFAVAGSTTTTKVELVPKPAAPPVQPPQPGDPRYHNFAAPPGMGSGAGEPTLGPGMRGQPAGGRTMYIAGLETLRVTWDDCTSPSNPLWEDKSFLLTSLRTLDPILFTDFVTGRTFVSQLGPKTSFLAYTDNDGGEDADTSTDYLPSQGSGINSGVDHQTVGGGPFRPGAPDNTNPLYSHAVYYASQDAAIAQMALSRDGGQTFGPAVPMYNLTQCGGLHGHIKVTPNTPATVANGHVGTVYLPNKGCSSDEGAGQGVIVSEDEGVSFQIRTVPGSSPGSTDPSLGIDEDGKIYFAFADGDGRAKVAVSSDKGVTWSTPYDVGAPFGIRNSVFPGAVGGSSGRAAVQFLATDTAGAFEALGEFTGVWHIYAAHTYDGGATWVTVRVTPENDPVQRGSICTGGLSCGADRNLLDFNDMEVDHEGRALIAYADGCIGCVSPTGADSRSEKATIARQSGGKRLFAQFDPNPEEPNPPAAPAMISAAKDKSGAIRVRWSEPDNGGSPITGYNVYRRTDAGAYGAPLVTLGAAKTAYDDQLADPNTAYFYAVTAFNSEGESLRCGEVPVTDAVAVETPCVAPGITLQTDPAGDGTIPQRDIRAVSVAELYDPASNANKIYFTIQMEDLAALPPQSRWSVEFTRTNPPGSPPEWGASTDWFVAMRTDDRLNPGSNLIPIFTYGHGEPPTTPGTSGTSVTDGNVDFGTFDSAKGTITIAISTPTKTNTAANARAFPPIQTGEPLGNVNAFTQQTTGVLLVSDDTTGGGTYTLVGNAFCRPNTAPVAALAANPTTGDAPLAVTFDASGSSDADAGDTIVTYAFNFGDGTQPVEQSSPTVQHTYAESGLYRATVRVKDSRDLLSDNAAGATIEVGADPPAQLLNISTRLHVQTGDNAGIAGFIITGSASKKIIVRGIGPSASSGGVPVAGRLNDTTLELHGPSGFITSNDNWKDSQQGEIESSGIPPSDDRESAIVQSLSPGNYTAILRGKNGETGIGLVEVYDLEQPANARLGNLSTRGFVGTGDNVMIGGVIAGPGDRNATPAVIRAMGPSLKSQLPAALDDPTLEIVDQNGAAFGKNDNWMETQKADIEATGLAPENDAESALFVPSLPPGQYTAIVRGKNGGTGLGLVEIYNLGNP